MVAYTIKTKTNNKTFSFIYIKALQRERGKQNGESELHNTLFLTVEINVKTLTCEILFTPTTF